MSRVMEGLAAWAVITLFPNSPAVMPTEIYGTLFRVPGGFL